jgi:hypothetical protein
MHHVVDSRLEVKVYGREHNCFLVIRDHQGEYRLEIKPDGETLAYEETLNGEPVKGS